MPVVGAIADRARANLPVTWDALAADTGRFGDGLIQSTIDTVKQRVLGTVLAPAAESALPLVVVDYLGKLVAIELCNPGIDFWMNEVTSESVTGTNENHTWIDRANMLRQLRDSLLDQTRLMWPEVSPLINYVPTSRAPRPLLNTINDEFLTPSPQEFPRPYRVTDRS